MLVAPSSTSISTIDYAQDCDNLQLTVAKEILSNGDTKISLTATGGTGPYYYILFDNKGNPISWEFDKKEIIVKKSSNKIPNEGKVIDSNGCIKIVEVQETKSK